MDVVTGKGRLTAGYNGAKLAHEQATLAGPIPAVVLRAAQFHEFADLATDAGVVPGSSAAPIPEIAGPREGNLVDMATLLAARRDDPRRR